MQDDALKKIRQHAYRLITYRPRSEKELSDRLKEKGYNAQAISRIISELKEEGLIDNRSFARLWSRKRLQTDGKGPVVIRMELLSKGIDKEIIADTIEELEKDFNEEDIARDLLKRKLRLVKGMDRRKARIRIFGYLKRRGFSNEIVYKLINETH